MNIYPFASGQTSYKQINHAILDDFDNHLLCGIQSVDWTASSLAFVQYIDESFVEYWQYSFFDTISGNSNSDCRYLAFQGPYIYAGLTIKSSSTSLLAPTIAKLNRNDGTIVYLRILPLDGSGNTLLQYVTGIMPSASSNKLLVMYRCINVVSGTTYYSPSGIRFDESTFIFDYHKVYYNIGSFTTSELYFQHFFKSEVDSAFYGFLQSPAASSPWVFKVDLTTGNTICKQQFQYTSSTSTYQGQVLDFSSTTFVSVFNFDTLKTNLEISIHSKATCAITIASTLVTMTSAITLRGATATVDSSSNIIVSASFNQLLIVKLDSGLNVLSKQMMNTGFYQLTPINTQLTSQGNFMFYYSGQLTSTDLLSSFIFMASPSLNFGTYGCFNILSYPQASDSTFAQLLTQAGGAAISMTGSPPANALTVIPPISISPIQEVFGVVGRGFNWAQDQSIKFSHQQLDGFKTLNYQQNPFNLQKCSSISGYTTITDPIVYEYPQNTGIHTITFTLPSLNCQNRPVACNFISGTAYTTAAPAHTWFFPNTCKYSIDTTDCFIMGGVYCPRTIFINLVYYDKYSTLQGNYYQAIQQRITKGNITLSNSNLNQCSHHPMPFVYGGNNQDSTATTLSVHPTDGNIVIGGQSYNVTNYGDNQDGFAMRISTTGIIEWMNYFNTMQGSASEFISTLEVSSVQGAVYCLFIRLSGTSIYSILKLSYSEGKIIWSRTVNFNQNRADGTFTFSTAPFSLLNPTTQSDFILAMQYLNGYILPTTISLSDNGINLIVNHQIQVERQGTSASNSIGEPIYHPSLNYYYISGTQGTNPFLYKVVTATGAYQYGLKITQTKTLAWSMPFLVYNTFNSRIYMAFAVSSGTYRINIYAIDDATQAIVAAKNLDPYQNRQSLHLSQDSTNGNILLVSYEFNANFITMLLDQNLNQLSVLCWSPVSINTKYRLGYQIGRDVYFAFSSTYLYLNGNYQIFVGRISLEHNYQKYMSKWGQNLNGGSANLADTLSTLGSSTLTIQTGLLASESSDVQMYLVQNYAGVFYPQRESYTNHVYVPPQSSTINLVINPPTQADLPVLECIKGQICTKTILPSSLQNCQGMSSASYTIYNVRSTTPGTYYSISGNTLTVDTTNTNAYPGFSQLYLTATIAGFGTVSGDVIQPVQIFPAGFVPASQTPTLISPTCAPITQWPKILESPWDSLLASAFDIDLNSGNFLVGGTSSSMYTQFYNNYVDGVSNAFNLLTDNNGLQKWGYTIYSNTPSLRNQVTSNIIFGADGYIYSLIRCYGCQFVGLLKQNYTHGTYIWMKQLNTSIATTGSNNYYVDSALFQDSTTNYIYITYYHSGLVNMNQIHKIDPTLNPPIHLYYNYFYYPGSCCPMTSYELKMFYSGGIGYLFAYGYTAGSTYNAKPTIIKYTATTGGLVLAKYFNINQNYQSYQRKAGMEIDSTGKIYTSIYFDTSSGDTFYFYQLDQNLNILQSRGSQISADYGIYLSDVCIDEANSMLYSMFSAGLYFYLFGLSTVNFKMIYLYQYIIFILIYLQLQHVQLVSVALFI